MEINGLQEIHEKLKALGNETAGKMLYPSLMYASTPMFNQVKANAPVLSGNIKRHIKRRRLTKGQSAYLKGAAMAIYVQIEGARNSPQNAYYYIFHEEYGARGRPPIPFIRPAFDANQQNATERFSNKVTERIEKVWNG
nr:HK97-gp10 family putative phage morphogenesis protein [uncultured Moraxella sp.]